MDLFQNILCVERAERFVFMKALYPDLALCTIKHWLMSVILNCQTVFSISNV